MASFLKPDSAGNGHDEDEDDYMNMTFDEPAPATESSIQRAQRLKKESRARGIIKSNEQLAKEEAAARERALATSMLEDPKSKKSKGLAMMAKMGFKGGSLGKKAENGNGTGRTEPIRISMKEDRGGIGMDNEKKRRLQEAAEERDIKTVKVDPDEYRERVRKEREEARLEKQLHAAQRTAERMDEESDQDSASTQETDDSQKPRSISSRPLQSVPVIYRGLIRHREEKERDRRMRHDLEQSLSRLPTYEENDGDEDENDRRALGKDRTVYVTADDLDEEDEELNGFNALEVGARLNRLLVYLRERHKYCFWCKMSYPDVEMEGCPGMTEEDHD